MPKDKVTYRVQWRYEGQERWFGYGADATNPPIEFDDIDHAVIPFTDLARNYYAHYYRIIDSNEDVIVPETKGVVMWAGGYDPRKASQEIKSGTIQLQEIKQRIGGALILPVLFPVGTFPFIDGTDPDAVPPLTIKKVRLWNSHKRTNVVGALRHGRRVQVIEYKLCAPERRYYYRVRSWFRTGWVSENFLSAEKKDVVGDLV